MGPYEILSSIGAGGMGEVYRARDPVLGRDVAIKVLPSSLSSDPERLRRFDLEARTVAALNHPNIVAVFQLGIHENAPFVVTELLEGETLREHLCRGAMPTRKAVEYAQQIVHGLIAAHEKGIVHRDLKPENIFVTRDGRVKILDFGLAKVTHSQHAVAAETAILTEHTEPGTLLGTVGYMSPEQVKGVPADPRSDLFSFGAILYEMLSGQRAFQKATWAEKLTAILTEDPPPLATVAPGVPPGLEKVVERCMEKNPDRRFQSAADLGFALALAIGSGSSPSIHVEPARPRAWLLWVPITAAAALVAIVLAALFTQRAADNSVSPVIASILPPPGEGFWANLTQPAAISPNGTFLAIISMRNARTQLWLRRMDSPEAQPVAGTENAANPFWSPDSRYVGFFADEKLKKVDVSGGVVTNICRSGRYSMGGTWSSQGVILFCAFNDKIKRVSAAGGTPEPVSGLPLSNDALGQYWPSFLPGGKHFFYLEWRYRSPNGPDNLVWIGSLDGDKPRRLPLTATNVEYSSGYLLFSRDGDLVAQPFDLQNLALRGSPKPVVRSIQYDTFFDNAAFTVSGNGNLVFAGAGTGVNTELTWMDASGKTIGTLGEPEQFLRQAISPDGKHVAVGVKTAFSWDRVWVYDVDRGTRIPLDPRVTYGPRWSSDGKQVAYRLTAGKTSEMYMRAANGSGAAKQVGGKFDGVMTVTDWSPDGHYLSCDFARTTGSQNWKGTLQVLPVAGEAKPRLEIEDAAGGRFSPDGNWLAYSDSNSNSNQVYVTRFPGPGPRIAVTSSGGGDPRWRGDGQELFYVSNDQTLVSVQVRETAQELRVLSARPLFHLALPSNAGFYDVTRDGKRFLVNTRTHKEQSAALTLVTNWSSILRVH